MAGSVLVLGAGQVRAILEDRETEIIDIVKEAYVRHHEGASSLPHSVFLRFPGNDTDRIIGLPAYLGVNGGIAGMKWVSSFPHNIERGMERASAAVFLNEMDTGRVKAILEGSIISAKRTAASAALAGRCLHGDPDEERVGLVGCGVINGQILRFLRAVFPKLARVVLYDLSVARMDAFIAANAYPGVTYEKVGGVEELFAAARLVSFATTAGTPYVRQLQALTAEHTVLGVSLRDLAPEIIESAYNVVDDFEHVCREKTSIHLTFQKRGVNDFVAGNIADAVTGRIPPRQAGRPSIFSPFGLGVLDIALADYVCRRAAETGAGTVIPDFLP